MTDRTTPTMDEVEDRLRRTFAAHAEDMADGDGDDARPGMFALEPARAAGRPNRTRRSMQLAAAVVVVALVAAGIVLRSDGGDDESDPAVAEGDDGSVVGLALAPRALVEALQTERAQASTWMVGADGVIQMPVARAAEARRITDAAAGLFETSLADQPDGAAYDGGLAALGDLGALRADIDATPEPRTFGYADEADAVFDRYTAMIDALLADQRSVAAAVDDPVARAGAEAHARGLTLVELGDRLPREVLWGVVMPQPATEGGDPLSEARSVQTLVVTELELLASETAGTPFEDAAAGAVAEVEASGALEVTSEAIEGDGLVDISTLLTAFSDEIDPWPAFLDQVEQALT